jgi:hypothetical protein
MTEIYTLSIELVRSRFASCEWTRKVEIPADTIVDDLHYLIQDTINFDDEHGYEFYIGNSPTSGKIVFAEPDDWDETEFRSIDTEIKDIYPLGKLKLYYLFDWGDNWLFQIKKDRQIEEAEPRAKYPRVIEAIGRNPLQYGDS